MSKLYLVGSLRNDAIPEIANDIEAQTDFTVFDDWFSAGPEADDYWKAHQRRRGRNYSEALSGPAAKNVFRFDKSHLDEADVGVLVLPAGRSGHLEIGYLSGRGKRTFILIDKETEENRWDVMTQFCMPVFNMEELIGELRRVEI